MDFKRSQIIWALWHSFAPRILPRRGLAEIPPVFARRVTKLIDLGVGLPTQGRVGQKGKDQFYEADAIFELGIGLDLLDLGLPQSEVASYLSAFGPQLRDKARSLPRQPKADANPEFLIVRPQVIAETARSWELAPAFSGPRIPFHPPEFVTGKRAKRNQFDMPIPIPISGHRELKALVIEVRDLWTKLN